MTWLARLFRRDKLEHQLDKELLFHIEQHAADLIVRGATPDEAHHRARRAIGGPEQVKEKCRDARGTRWLEDLAQDTRYALRTFRQKPGFAIIALLILALGIGATTVMFTVINGVLLKPLEFPNPDQLMTLHGSTKDFGEFWGFSGPDACDVAKDARSFTAAAWNYGGGTISSPGEPEYVLGRQVTANFFSTLGVPMREGRDFSSDDDKLNAASVAIISPALARRHFAKDAKAIGFSLIFEGKSYTIVGIFPSSFRLAGNADIFTPLHQNSDTRAQRREARFIHVIARRNAGVTPDEAQAELDTIARRLAREFPATNADLGMLVRPLRIELVGTIGSTLWLLLIAVALVLLIACVNIASLMLARAVSRERELAMRVALGAGLGRLVRQCLTESAVLGLAGGALGVAIAAIGIGPFVAFWPGSLPRAGEIQIDWRILLFALGVSLFSGLVFGLAPALRVPIRNLESALRIGGRTIAGSSRRLHGIFVVAEIALAFVLLASAGMLGRTLLKLSSLDPGLNTHNLLTARFALSPASLTTPAQMRAAWQSVLDQLRSTTGVQSAALSDIIPMRDGENVLPYSTTPLANPSDAASFALASTVTPDYLAVTNIPLRSGRFFTDDDKLGNAPIIVIDQNLARHAFGTTNVVGRRLYVPNLNAEPSLIVGVVGHVRHWGLAGDDQSRVHDQIYYPFAQVPDHIMRFFSTVMSVAIRTKGDPSAMITPLRSELRGGAGDQMLYDTSTMDQLVAASLDSQRFLLLLFGIFAALALLLACIGIYGVLSYLTTQRIPEIGVRMALGATTREVVRLILRQSLAMILTGIAIGFLAALAAARLLRRMVEGMQPAEPLTFAAMIAILFATALLASYIPARRASHTNPVEALRQD
jgi:putative ABC transport system permease protein